MTGWELFFVILGITYLTKGLFWVVERIDGKRV